MLPIKKRHNKLLYKKLLPLRKNTKNKSKLLRFRKKKWQKFQNLIMKQKRQKFFDPVAYFLSTFKNFFSRKFKYNLQNKQRLSFFYGKLRKKSLKKVVNFALKEFKGGNSHATALFVEKLESRLDTALYRTYFSDSFNHARQLILHKKVYVNNRIVPYNSYLLKKGDLITLNEKSFHLVVPNIMKSKP